MSATRPGKRKEPPPPHPSAAPHHQDCLIQSVTYWKGPKPIGSARTSELNDPRNWVTHEYHHPQNNEGRGEEVEPRWLPADVGKGLLTLEEEDEWPLFVPPPITTGRTADATEHQSQPRGRRRGVHSSSTAMTSSARRSKRVAESRNSTRSERRRGRPKRDQSDNDTDTSSSSTEDKEGSYAQRHKRLRSYSGIHEKSRSRVGHRYQVSQLPIKSSAFLEPCEGHVIWDPVQAEEAIKRGEDIEAFLRKGKELPVSTLLMEALHNTGYNTSNAMGEFIKTTSKLDKRLDHVTVEMPDAERMELADLFRKETAGKKDFVAIAKATGYSMEKVLVQYYRWKGETRDEYKVCKLARLKSIESDWCFVCDDGGTLIVCDLCRKSYHLKCLIPPLKRIPEGDWYCPSCILKSPAKVRNLCATGGTPKRSMEKQSTRRKDNDTRATPTKLFTPSGARSSSAAKLYRVAEPSAVSRRDVLRSLHKELDPKQLAKFSSKRQSRSSVSSDYQVLCPVTSEGLLIKVMHDRNGVRFNGYRRFPNDAMGPAEEKQLFREIGDLLVAVDNKSIVGLSWDAAKKMLAEHNGKSQRLLSLRNCNEPMEPPTQPKNPPGDVAGSGRTPQDNRAAQSATQGRPAVGHAPKDCDKAADPKKSGVSTIQLPAQSSSGPRASQSNESAVSQSSQLARSSTNYKSISEAKSSSGVEEDDKKTTDSVKSAADPDSSYNEEEANGSSSSDDDNLAVADTRKPAPVHKAACGRRVQPPCPGVAVNRKPASGGPLVPIQKAASSHINNSGATAASAAGDSARAGGATSASAASGSGSFVPRQVAPVTNKAVHLSSSNATSDEYDAQIKVTVEGLLIKVHASNDGICTFEGYRRFSNGENSPDSWSRPFRNIGDRIIAIDGQNVERMSTVDVINMLSNNNNKRFRSLRMREVRKST